SVRSFDMSIKVTALAITILGLLVNGSDNVQAECLRADVDITGVLPPSDSAGRMYSYGETPIAFASVNACLSGEPRGTRVSARPAPLCTRSLASCSLTIPSEWRRAALGRPIQLGAVDRPCAAYKAWRHARPAQRIPSVKRSVPHACPPEG